MINVTTPPGRIVQGNPNHAITKNMQGIPFADGRVEHFFALAIAKTDPGWNPMFAQIQAEALASHPQSYPLHGILAYQMFAIFCQEPSLIA